MTDETRDLRDRLIRLEVEVKTLTDKSEAAFRKLDEMHGLLLQARGARWAILGMAAIGGFLASKVGNVLPWLTGFPR
jgi:hypothetical protein